MNSSDTEDEADILRREGRALAARARAAMGTIESALVAYGASRHPLVDVLLDVRNSLRGK